MLKGLSFREVNGTSARVEVLDGSSNGVLVATVTLINGESVRDWFAEQGVLLESGLFVAVQAGTVAGAVWAIPENRFEGFSFPSIWAEGAQ